MISSFQVLRIKGSDAYITFWIYTCMKTCVTIFSEEFSSQSMFLLGPRFLGYFIPLARHPLIFVLNCITLLEYGLCDNDLKDWNPSKEGQLRSSSRQLRSNFCWQRPAQAESFPILYVASCSLLRAYCNDFLCSVMNLDSRFIENHTRYSYSQYLSYGNIFIYL